MQWLKATACSGNKKLTGNSFKLWKQKHSFWIIYGWELLAWVHPFQLCGHWLPYCIFRFSTMLYPYCLVQHTDT